MRILITGINGNIGTVLRNALTDSHDLYGLDEDGPFSDRVISADIAEYGEVIRVVQQFSPVDAIIHLVGNPSVKASWEAVLHANIIGTRNIFEAAREFQVRRVVFASSNHVTGAYEGFAPNLYLHTQHEPIRPDSDYGVSKAFGKPWRAITARAGESRLSACASAWCCQTMILPETRIAERSGSVTATWCN